MLVKAFAKINLYLRVLSRRPDGYHNIETIYQSVSLADTLEFSRDLSVDRVNLYLFPNSAFIVSTDESNFVLRAVNLLQQSTEKEIRHLRIGLDKQIPVGGGLGGGSTDAAATLFAVNQLFSLGFNEEALLKIATSLGADVPFFFWGGTALARGKGEIISPLENNLQYYVIVVFPSFPITTTEAYKRLDEYQGACFKKEPQVNSIIEALKRGSLTELKDSMTNSFSEVIEGLYPETKTMREDLLAAGCLAAQLTGSGSAVFGICETIEESRRVKEIISKEYNYVYICKPTSQGMNISD